MRCIVSSCSASFPWACILLLSCAVRVHDSQAYRKMDRSRDHIELREILLSFQTGFNIVSAVVVCAILGSISSLEPSSVITEPRYLKLVTVSSFCPFTLISVLMPQVSSVLLVPVAFISFRETHTYLPLPRIPPPPTPLKQSVDGQANTLLIASGTFYSDTCTYPRLPSDVHTHIYPAKPLTHPIIQTQSCKHPNASAGHDHLLQWHMYIPTSTQQQPLTHPTIWTQSCKHPRWWCSPQPSPTLTHVPSYTYPATGLQALCCLCRLSSYTVKHVHTLIQPAPPLPLSHTHTKQYVLSTPHVCAHQRALCWWWQPASISYSETNTLPTPGQPPPPLSTQSNMCCLSSHLWALCWQRQHTCLQQWNRYSTHI